MPPRKPKTAPPAAGPATAVADQEPEVLDLNEPVDVPPAPAPARDAAGAPAKTRKDGSFPDLDGVAQRLAQTDARELPVARIIADCWHQEGAIEADQVNAAMRLLAKDKRFSLHVRDQVYHVKLATMTTKAPAAPRSPTFEQGVAAHAAGKDCFDNPYGAAHSGDAAEWEDGWLAAENAKPAPGEAPVAVDQLPPGPVAKAPGAVADAPPDVQLDKVVTGEPTVAALDGFDDMPGEDDEDESDDEDEDDDLVDDEDGDDDTLNPEIHRAQGKDAAAGESAAPIAEVAHAAGAYLNHDALGRVKVLRYEGAGAERRIVVVTEQGQEKELLVAFVAGKLKPALDNGRTIGEMVAEVKAPPAPAPFAVRIGRWVLVKSAVGDGSEPGWISDIRPQQGGTLYDVVLKSGKVNGLKIERLAEMTAALEATHDRMEEVDRLRALVDAQNRHAEEQRALTKQYRRLLEEAASIAERAKTKRKEIEAMVERMAVHGGGDVQMDWRDGLPPEADDEEDDDALDLAAPATKAVEAKKPAPPAPVPAAEKATEIIPGPGAIAAPKAPEKAASAPAQPAATAAKGKGSLRDQARSQQALREALPANDLGLDASAFPAAELVITADAGTIVMPVFMGGELYVLIRDGLPDGYAELRRLWTPAAWARDAELEYGQAKPSAELVEKDLKLERGGRRAGLLVKAKGRTWAIGPMVDSFYVKLG